MPSRATRLSVTLAPPDNRALANLCGPLDLNLRQIEAALDVTITHRAGAFTVTGENPQAQRAVEALQRFYATAEKPLSVEDIQLGLVEISTHPEAKAPVEPAADGSPHLRTRRADLHGRTPNQVEYLKDIIGHDITFGIGPAGTGKTYLAVACAVDALERDAVKRIVLVRPAVEAGEKLGFLPGDLAQKVDPYLRPLYDALYDLMGFDKAARLFEYTTIELAPLAYMRGRTLNHSFIILDEAQNTTRGADEDVPDAHRLRHQGRDHRRCHADRPGARPEERPRGSRGACWQACAALLSATSPVPMSCATRWCRK